MVFGIVTGSFSVDERALIIKRLFFFDFRVLICIFFVVALREFENILCDILVDFGP
jgi:hypothetical protein